MKLRKLHESLTRLAGNFTGTMASEMKSSSLTTEVTIVHPQGIHLRVGKDLAYVANRFVATTTARNVTLSSPPVDLKSILQIMRLQARTGHIIQLTAVGQDAEEAIMALKRVFEYPAQDNSK